MKAPRFPAVFCSIFLALGNKPGTPMADIRVRKAIYMAYTGGLPNVSAIDEEACLHFRDQSCDACVAAWVTTTP